MSKPVEIGSTLAVVAVFIAMLLGAGVTQNKQFGTLAALALFVVLSSAAGYYIARVKYPEPQSQS